MRLGLLSIAALPVLGLWAAPAAAADPLLVIANPSVPAASLSPARIAALYLLKVTTWPDGQRVVPVNREASSATRARFTGQVLREDNAALAAYWNEMHFKGKRPPLIEESDQAVAAFVRNVPGAIGYIRASTPHPGVKVVERLP